MCQERLTAIATQRTALSQAVVQNGWQGEPSEQGSTVVDVLASQLDAMCAVEGMQTTMRSDQRVFDLYSSAARAVFRPEQWGQVGMQVQVQAWIDPACIFSRQCLCCFYPCSLSCSFSCTL